LTLRRRQARNRQKLAEYAHRHYVMHREQLKGRRKAYLQRAKNRIRAASKAWIRRNLERYRAWLAEYRKRPEVIARNRARFLKRKATEPNFALGLALRCRIRRAIKVQSGVKARKSRSLLGCSIQHARRHIEAQFEPGMTWENFGRNGWHLDHVIPCSAFDLRNPMHQRRCFHYSNLKPMWQRENIRKGAAVPGELPLQYRLPTRTPAIDMPAPA
jgi:hypothetical protein